MNNIQTYRLVEDLERPTKRMQRAIGAIRELQHECEDSKARAHSLAITVAALQDENRRLRKLLDDMHAANASPSAIAAERERLQHERDEYMRERGGAAALKNLRQE